MEVNMHTKTNKPQWNKLILTLVGVAALLSGCGVGAPQETPTPDPAVIAATVAVIQTQAVETAVAQITVDAALNPSATPTAVPPTNTPEPTATLAPSATLPPPPTATFIPATAKPTNTSTPAALQCSVVSASPANKAEMTPGQDFDGKWTFKNSGTEAWDANDIDFRYYEGHKFQTSVDGLDLTEKIEVGDTASFVIDMVAPTEKGSYTANWALSFGASRFCVVTVSIVVK